MYSKRKAISLCTFVLILSCVPACAQFTSGVDGTVQDSSGASIPGATVNVRDTRLGVTRSVTSNQAGYFRVDNIAASTYDVEIKMSSFKTWTEDGLTLQAGEIRTIAPILDPGDVATTVSVSAAPGAVDLASATTGAVVAQETVTQTPLVGQERLRSGNSRSWCDGGGSHSGRQLQQRL
jgi:Carboxypeptidase regulatory-like domain